jgi:uncharacterized protein
VSMVLDVRDLLGQPGSFRNVHVSEPIEGLQTPLAAVPEDRPVQADLLMESVVEGVLASGPVEGVMELSCARCLKRFDARFQVPVQELFRPGAGAEDDEYPVVEGFADLEPMLRDVVVLAMPFAPLCREDCLGLCERCGGDRNLGECRCEKVADARWSVLSTIELDREE